MKYVLLLMVSIIIFGCAQQQYVVEKNNTFAKNMNITDQLSKFETNMFDDFLLTFNYPKSMKWHKNVNNYDNGKGYGSVKFSDADSNIIIAYFYAGNISDIKTTDPFEVAATNLYSEATAGKDPLGVLENIISMDKIKKEKMDIGYAALTNFKVKRKGSTLYGTAMDIFVPDSSVLYSVRISSNDQSMAEVITDQFKISAKFSIQ